MLNERPRGRRDLGEKERERERDVCVCMCLCLSVKGKRAALQVLVKTEIEIFTKIYGWEIRIRWESHCESSLSPFFLVGLGCYKRLGERAKPLYLLINFLLLASWKKTNKQTVRF